VQVLGARLQVLGDFKFEISDFRISDLRFLVLGFGLQVLWFVGRAFRHDTRNLLTPEFFSDPSLKPARFSGGL
jgi:hypothetical protein